ncbi:MAG: hypothetical protein QMD85_00635 [Candidatus Aenigmarchaeota archaeon]|nr:hypothetical protein [Candidatus Aenigmarchaeota archaeon]MDI6722033.1 hypothetical protein [Candidatus Aenigmarchaeota archaeon]
MKKEERLIAKFKKQQRKSLEQHTNQQVIDDYVDEKQEMIK